MRLQNRPIEPTSLAIKVLLVDDDPDRAAEIRAALQAIGYRVVSQLASSIDLYVAMHTCKPDVVIVGADSPSRDALEHIALVSRDAPKPIVMFATDARSATIREAVRAGVSAYVVDGLAPERLQPILTVAVERFAAMQQLRDELAETRTALKARKLIERAKGMLMKQRDVDEETAYRLLRKFAMDQGVNMQVAAERTLVILKASA